MKFIHPWMYQFHKNAYDERTMNKIPSYPHTLPIDSTALYSYLVQTDVLHYFTYQNKTYYKLNQKYPDNRILIIYYLNLIKNYQNEYDLILEIFKNGVLKRKNDDIFFKSIILCDIEDVRESRQINLNKKKSAKTKNRKEYMIINYSFIRSQVMNTLIGGYFKKKYTLYLDKKEELRKYMRNDQLISNESDLEKILDFVSGSTQKDSQLGNQSEIRDHTNSMQPAIDEEHHKKEKNKEVQKKLSQHIQLTQALPINFESFKLHTLLNFLNNYNISVILSSLHKNTFLIDNDLQYELLINKSIYRNLIFKLLNLNLIYFYKNGYVFGEFGLIAKNICKEMKNREDILRKWIIVFVLEYKQEIQR